MEYQLLLKFIGYFSDYLSALSRTLLRFFGQPLSKQLYKVSSNIRNLWLAYFMWTGSGCSDPIKPIQE